MKKSELKSLILEAIKEEMVEEANEPINEVGNVIVVKKPNGKLVAEDLIQEMSIYDSIMKEDVLGVFMENSKSKARQLAREAIKNYETQQEALKTQMEEFRKLKKEVADKRKIAKETIGKLKS
jgi:hypothetical protein